MPNYIALLRGINVGGKNLLAMSRVREIVADLGYSNVQTYIQSGNILLSSPARPDKIRRAIADVLQVEMGTAIPIMIRSSVELAAIVANNPFLIPDPSPDLSQLHVTLFDGTPTPAALQSLNAIVPTPSTPPASRADRFHLLHNAIYLRCQGGYGNTRLTNALVERTLGVNATTRNWKTMTTLHSLASTQK